MRSVDATDADMDDGRRQRRPVEGGDEWFGAVLAERVIAGGSDGEAGLLSEGGGAYGQAADEFDGRHGSLPS